MYLQQGFGSSWKKVNVGRQHLSYYEAVVGRSSRVIHTIKIRNGIWDLVGLDVCLEGMKVRLSECDYRENMHLLLNIIATVMKCFFEK